MKVLSEKDGRKKVEIDQDEAKGEVKQWLGEVLEFLVGVTEKLTAEENLTSEQLVDFGPKVELLFNACSVYLLTYATELVELSDGEFDKDEIADKTKKVLASLLRMNRFAENVVANAELVESQMASRLVCLASRVLDKPEEKKAKEKEELKKKEKGNGDGEESET